MTRLANGYVGVGAAWKVAQVEEGSTVAIFGLGSVGLAVCYFNGFYVISSGSVLFQAHNWPLLSTLDLFLLVIYIYTHIFYFSFIFHF